MSKMKNCKSCGAAIANSASTCPACGSPNPSPVCKWIWLGPLLALAVVFAVARCMVFIAAIEEMIGFPPNSDITNTVNAPASSSDNVSPASIHEAVSASRSVFDGDCGIAASAEMGNSILGFPELTISITNTSEKDISAIQFYAVPCDVYGEEITGWTSQNELYTDTKIEAGKSTSITYSFMENSIKTVKLYAYHVYFADGSEWGNKSATRSTILTHGLSIEVAGES